MEDVPRSQLAKTYPFPVSSVAQLQLTIGIGPSTAAAFIDNTLLNPPTETSDPSTNYRRTTGMV